LFIVFALYERKNNKHVLENIMLPFVLSEVESMS